MATKIRRDPSVGQKATCCNCDGKLEYRKNPLITWTESVYFEHVDNNQIYCPGQDGKETWVRDKADPKEFCTERLGDYSTICWRRTTIQVGKSWYCGIHGRFRLKEHEEREAAREAMEERRWLEKLANQEFENFSFRWNLTITVYNRTCKKIIVSMEELDELLRKLERGESARPEGEGAEGENFHRSDEAET